MKIIIEEPEGQEEDSIIIRCRELSDDMMKMIYGLKNRNQRIPAAGNGSITMVAPEEVYYFETVDNRVFLYTETEVYETKMKLYEIEEQYPETDFFRASKSTILNLSRIKHLTPAFSGRFEAVLQNGERLIISRQYVGKLKEKLGV